MIIVSNHIVIQFGTWYIQGDQKRKLVKVNSYNSKNTKRRTLNKKSHERMQLQVLFDIHVTAVLYIFHSLTSFF